MYCVKCGVELADSEIKCPLCSTEVIIPSGMARNEAEMPYPRHPGRVTEGISRSGLMFILTFLSIIPIIISLLCDLNLNGGITWSGYVIGSIILSYICLLLPLWFKKANPVIFVPVSFFGICLFLLYINIKTGGNWFLPLAFPVVSIFAVIASAVVTLVRYTRGGELFIYGGASILFGGYAILIEYFVKITFGIQKMFRWSLYPFSAMFLIGIMLIIIGICRPLRESLKRKLFF